MVNDFDMDAALNNLIYFLSTLFIIFGGAIPYIPQYLTIISKKSAKGFSTYVCLTLLIANILRICFWFGERFSPALLIQSFVMIAAMLVMMHVSITTTYDQRICSPWIIRRFRDFEYERFWDWTDFWSYVEFLSLFSLLCFGITLLGINNYTFIQTIGFISLFTEAMLAVPQFLKNLDSKSTQGMSLLMVALWTCGDVFKTIYFVVEGAPLQFLLCGFIQIGLDLAIFGQYLFYGTQEEQLGN